MSSIVQTTLLGGAGRHSPTLPRWLSPDLLVAAPGDEPSLLEKMVLFVSSPAWLKKESLSVMVGFRFRNLPFRRRGFGSGRSGCTLSKIFRWDAVLNIAPSAAGRFEAYSTQMGTRQNKDQRDAALQLMCAVPFFGFTLL